MPPDFTGQMRLNGGLDSQPVVKKRRGRRKNVEGMDLLFMNQSRVPSVPEQVNMSIFHLSVFLFKFQRVRTCVIDELLMCLMLLSCLKDGVELAR